MTVIGVTGPSGAGKGVVSDMIQKHGAYVIDCDVIYSEIIKPPSLCLDELCSFFGQGILSSDGTLDRYVLSSIVFGEENKDKLLKLNDITHKYVVAETREIVKRLMTTDTKICVIDAPLLIESGLCRDCNITVCVLADRAIRADRISERDSIDIDKAMARIDSQKRDEFYIENTDHSIYNNGDLQSLSESVDKILAGGLI